MVFMDLERVIGLVRWVPQATMELQDWRQVSSVYHQFMSHQFMCELMKEVEFITEF
jgi:hypothetical protein